MRLEVGQEAMAVDEVAGRRMQSGHARAEPAVRHFDHQLASAVGNARSSPRSANVDVLSMTSGVDDDRAPMRASVCPSRRTMFWSRLPLLSMCFVATVAEAQTWRQPLLSNRLRHALAYDFARGRTVLFGGL